MNTPYDVQTDSIIQLLIAEAAADPDVIGLVLTGSRAVAAVTPESDYDVLFVVTNEALTRYEQTHTTPLRGTTITPPSAPLTSGTTLRETYSRTGSYRGCYQPMRRHVCSLIARAKRHT